MVRIGIIGIGFMGMTHFEGATKFKDDAKSGRRKISGSKLKGGKVTAIATRNQKSSTETGRRFKATSDLVAG